MTSSDSQSHASAGDSSTVHVDRTIKNQEMSAKPRLSRRGRKPKKPKNTTGDMSIAEHLQELRKRLFLALLAIGVGTIFGYFWYAHELGPIPSLGDIFIWPYCSLPEESRFGASNGECTLIAIGVFEQFALRLKVGGLVGLVLSSPVWLALIWGYITPGLKSNEKRWSMIVGGTAGFLFFLGAILAYFVLSEGLGFLLTMGGETQVSALTGEKYFSFAIGLLLVFGVSFEVPLITALLNAAGLISYEQLKEKRRYIFVFLFIFAAFMTPGQDPISMVVLSISLCLMMEIATQIARFNDKRRADKQKDWLDVDDESASSIAPAAPLQEQGVTGASAASTIERPTSVARAESITGDAVEPTPAPRSSSGARPATSEYLPAQTTTNSQPEGNNGGPDKNPGQNSYFDDVL